MNFLVIVIRGFSTEYDVNRSLDQVYLNAATLNVSSYQQQSLDSACLEGQQSAEAV